MLTIRFVPYSELSRMEIAEKIAYILDLVQKNKIILLQGRLNPKEEAELIKATMEKVGKRFRGIELAVFNPESVGKGLGWVRDELAKMLLGRQAGLTLIGPASVIKAIKQEPTQLKLYTRHATSMR